MQSTMRSPEFAMGSTSSSPPSNAVMGFNPSASRMAVDELGPRHSDPATPTVGTPIRLAPSTSAFRRPGAGAPVTPSPLQPAVPMPASVSGMQQSPSKGMLGQVSDLLFGW